MIFPNITINGIRVKEKHGGGCILTPFSPRPTLKIQVSRFFILQMALSGYDGTQLHTRYETAIWFLSLRDHKFGRQFSGLPPTSLGQNCRREWNVLLDPPYYWSLWFVHRLCNFIDRIKCTIINVRGIMPITWRTGDELSETLMVYVKSSCWWK